MSDKSPRSDASRPEKTRFAPRKLAKRFREHSILDSVAVLIGILFAIVTGVLAVSVGNLPATNMGMVASIAWLAVAVYLRHLSPHHDNCPRGVTGLFAFIGAMIGLSSTPPFLDGRFLSASHSIGYAGLMFAAIIALSITVFLLEEIPDAIERIRQLGMK